MKRQMKRLRIYKCLTCLFIGVLVKDTFGQPGPEQCASGGGPTICVRFDNKPTAPQATVHYTFDFSTPSAPSVVLLQGEESPGNLYEWRVWSKNAQQQPAAIGDITSPGAYNYSVSIRTPTDGSGAANVGSINLTPDGNYYSNIAGGTITGNVTGGLTVRPNSAGAGGRVIVSIQYGTLGGSSTIHEVVSLQMGTQASLSGSLEISKLTGTMQFNRLLSGSNMHIENAYGTGNAAIYVTEEFSGAMEIDRVVNDPEADDDLYVYLFAPMSATGRLDFHDLGFSTLAIIGLFTNSPVEGNLKFWQGIGDGSKVTLYGPLIGPNAKIDLNDFGVGVGAFLNLSGGGDGEVINGGRVKGSVHLGEDHCDPGDCHYFTGAATFADVDPSASILLYGDGIVEFDGFFEGNICGTGIPGSPYLLPPNVYITAIGTQGRACGNAMCPAATFSADPSGLNKTRFISFTTNDTSTRAIGVKLTSLHEVNPPYSGGPTNPCQNCPGLTCDGCEGQTRWIGPPATYVESVSSGIEFQASQLQCSGEYRNWSTVGLLHVTGSAIVPSSQYDVQLLVGDNAACASPSLSLVTTRWGDVETPYNPPSQTAQPDVGDISALVNKFRSAIGAPIKARALLTGTDNFGTVAITPDLSFGHIASCVDAFRGQGYPFQISVCP